MHDNIKMERTLKGGIYNTICLPFSISDEEQLPEELRFAEVKQFTGITSSIDANGEPIAVLEFATLVSPTEMKAGVPYIIKPDQDVDAEYITFNHITEANVVENGPYSETQDGITFQGVYNPTTLPQDALILNEENYLVHAENGAEVIKGYRGYFTINDPELSNLAAEGRLYFSIKQSTTTDIISPETDIPQVRKFFHNGRFYILRDTTIYDMMGVQMK